VSSALANQGQAYQASSACPTPNTENKMAKGRTERNMAFTQMKYLKPKHSPPTSGKQ